MKKYFISLGAFLTAAPIFGQLQPDKMTPESSELWTPVPRVVTPGIKTNEASGTTAPSDATVLFDGTNLDNWVSSKDGQKPAWTVVDGALTVAAGKGDIQTTKDFGDYQLHIEWRSPAEVIGDGQGRGNSGIFMQGVYELQVLDNYNNVTYSNGQAGSIYKQSMPLVNACLKPGEWQAYDVFYTAPRYNKDGIALEAPYITVVHNGVLVQHHTQIQGTTPFVGQPENAPHGRGPIKLQDHGNPVSYRNIWIREL